MTTFLEQIISEIKIIRIKSKMNNGVVRAKSLNKDIGLIKVASSDASDNLSKKSENTLFSGEIW